MSRLQQARNLSKLLHQLLSERGWSARELSRRSQLSATSIQNYVDGITLPNRESREKLASLMDKSIDELDLEIGVITSASPDRTVEALCRDIRLLDSKDFQAVVEVVFDRVLKELNQPPTETKQ